MDKYNLVSGELTPEKAKEMLDTIARWRSEMTFLAPLDESTRGQVAKPGIEGVRAAVTVANAAQEHPNSFPKDIADPAEIKRDAALVEILGPVSVALRSFSQAVDDTVLAAKSDAYRGGLKLYAVAKLLKATIPGLTEKVAALKEILDRPARKNVKAEK